MMLRNMRRINEVLVGLITQRSLVQIGFQETGNRKLKTVKIQPPLLILTRIKER